MEKEKITYLVTYQHKYKEYDKFLDALKWASKQELKGLAVRVYRHIFPPNTLFDRMDCIYYTNMEVR